MTRRFAAFVLSNVALIPLAWATGCSSDDAAESNPGSGGNAGSAGDAGTDATGPKGPGSACSCDSECVGDGSAPMLCLHGMCATRASAVCTGPATPDGCPAGSKCYDVLALGGNGVCLPDYDASTCSGGAENRDGVCAPIKGQGCDASCGTLCTLPEPAPGSAGAACGQDAECQLADPTCYQGSSQETVWPGGYCLAFGCTDAAACGAGGDCLAVSTTGDGVCVQKCGSDLDCRIGYTCSEVTDGNGLYCRAGCDAAATCPTGHACVGKQCVDETIACSPSNPTGYCPDGSWCDKGTCNDQPFACDGSKDALEPNDTQQAAVPAPAGTTHGLTICKDDDDWFEITVPKGKIVRVGIEFQHAAGDLDLVVHDASGQVVASRVGDYYPYSDRNQETNTEYYGLWSEAGGTKYFVRATGLDWAENVYSLHVDEFDYQDGADCLALEGFEACVGQKPNGEGLIPFPLPDPAATSLTDNYQWDTYANYRFARREMVMLIRHALAETSKAFPGTTPLGMIDVCQIDGITPGYDVDDPRHPESTHDQGGNIDIAYFQTDGNNSAQIVCGDGSQHADGFCSPAAKDVHIVDLPRQAFFMAQIFSYSRLRVIGVDQVLAPLIQDAATQLSQLPDGDPKKITAQQASMFYTAMASGSGWPFHHHHIHVSLDWWTQAQWKQGAKSPFASEAAARRAGDLRVAWPPRRGQLVAPLAR